MRLWILGDGGERARLESLAADMGIPGSPPEAAGTAHFAGWLSQAECALRLQEADCLVLPSLLECGGAVVLEAMSLGKPVIATAWGGPLDYLDSACGVLVPPDSRDAVIEGFVGAMVALAKSEATRLRLGAAGLAKVRTDYDWELKVDKMLGVYAQAQATSIRPSAGGAARGQADARRRREP